MGAEELCKLFQLVSTSASRYTSSLYILTKVERFITVMFHSGVYPYIYLAMFINYQFLDSCPCVRESSSSIELCAGAAVSPCDCNGGTGCQV